MLKSIRLLTLPLALFKKLFYSLMVDEKNLPGSVFHSVGTRFGRKLMLKGIFSPKLLFNPVSIVRFFEFDFISRNINLLQGKTIIDVSSPFLFGFYAAEKYQILYKYINPDKKDLKQVIKYSKKLNFRGDFQASTGNALNLQVPDNSVDGIISISVIEHIANDGDIDFMKEAERVLKPSGFLAITFPVSKDFKIEYKSDDIYGLNYKRIGDKYFFQRIYNNEAITNRLLSNLKFVKLEKMEIFGEKENTFYEKYQKRWVRFGLLETVKDPYYISKYFRYFKSINDLPGIGVAGLFLRKINEL